MQWPEDSVYTFSLVLGLGTPYVATLYFTPNDDICGEGYRGYDYKIAFSNPTFNSDLWAVSEQAGNSDTVKADAADRWRQIVAFITNLQGQRESNPL